MLSSRHRRDHRSLCFTGGEPMTWTDSGLNMGVLLAPSGNSDLVVFGESAGANPKFWPNGGVLSRNLATSCAEMRHRGRYRP